MNIETSKMPWSGIFCQVYLDTCINVLIIGIITFIGSCFNNIFNDISLLKISWIYNNLIVSVGDATLIRIKDKCCKVSYLVFTQMTKSVIGLLPLVPYNIYRIRIHSSLNLTMSIPNILKNYMHFIHKFPLALMKRDVGIRQ